MAGVTLEDYREKRFARSSVEREFISIGEALRRISMLDNWLFMNISNSRSIVDLGICLPITREPSMMPLSMTLSTLI